MPILLILIIKGFIRKEATKSNVIIMSAIVFVGIAMIIWFFTPTDETVPAYDDVDIYLYFYNQDTQEDVQVRLTEEQQKDEMMINVKDLSLQRNFFYGYQNMHFDASEYVYVSIHFKANEKTIDRKTYHLTLNENGFTYGRGYGFDKNYSRINNPEDIIEYIKNLSGEYVNNKYLS